MFGCEAYLHVPREKRSKLEPKSRKCIFMGYEESGKMAYRLWDPEARKIVRSSDVIFNEKKMHKQLREEHERYHSRISCHQLSCNVGKMLSHQMTELRLKRQLKKS